MERIAELLQGFGAIAVAVGLFSALAWPLAVLVLGGLAVGCGIVLEIGARPRKVATPGPLSPADRRTAVLSDYARTASER
jgi:hypothetical protein